MPLIKDEIDTEILTIANLFNEDDSLKKYMEIRYGSRNSINYMDYYGIYEAMSIEWKRIMKNNEPTCVGKQ